MYIAIKGRGTYYQEFHYLNVPIKVQSVFRSYSTWLTSKLPTSSLSITAGQQHTCYSESVLWNRLKTDLNHFSDPSAFRTSVRRWESTIKEPQLYLLLNGRLYHLLSQLIGEIRK